MSELVHFKCSKNMRVWDDNMDRMNLKIFKAVGNAQRAGKQDGATIHLHSLVKPERSGNILMAFRSGRQLVLLGQAWDITFPNCKEGPMAAG